MRCVKGVVVWDKNAAADFREAYTPEFDSVPDAKLERFFGEAALIVSNSPCSLVKSCCERIKLYTLLIAWKAFDDGRGAGLVGGITSASQGSVSLGLSGPDKSEVPFPYNSNNYGASYWAATAKYRVMEYVPDPCRRPRRPRR